MAVRDHSHHILRSRLWLRRNINPMLERGSRLLAPTGWLQGREVVFQGIVHRELDRLNIHDVPLYPLRSAATYSYLYLLLRLVQEFDDLQILELGAGQSTVLLDRFAALFPVNCTTLEHDPDWQQRIQRRVSSPVLAAPLVPASIRGHAAEVYDASVVPAQQRFNVLLVDGPRSSRQRSRWGCLQFIERNMQQEFLLVFDDAERRGELQTIAAALRLLDDAGVRYRTNLVRSINSQFLIATPAFQLALTF
jgi:predicted O-methyltransferase YrrM